MPWLEIGMAAGVLAIIGSLILALVRKSAKLGASENEVIHAGVDRAKTVEGAEILGTPLSDDDLLSGLPNRDE